MIKSVKGQADGRCDTDATALFLLSGLCLDFPGSRVQAAGLLVGQL